MGHQRLDDVYAIEPGPFTTVVERGFAAEGNSRLAMMPFFLLYVARLFSSVGKFPGLCVSLYLPIKYLYILFGPVSWGCRIH